MRYSSLVILNHFLACLTTFTWNDWTNFSFYGSLTTDETDQLFGITLDQLSQAWPHPYEITEEICWRILNPDFLDMCCLQKVRKTLFFFLIQVKKYIRVDKIFTKTDKPFWVVLGLLGPSWLAETFFQKSGLLSLLILWLSNFMQKFRKNWWANFEVLCCERRDEQTDEQCQFHRTLPLKRMSKNNWKTRMVTCNLTIKDIKKILLGSFRSLLLTLNKFDVIFRILHCYFW